MKKKESSLRKSFPAIVLYLDDLEEIVSILRKSTDKIIINCGEYEYESLDELVTHLNTGKCQGLEISTHTPYVHIEINRQAIEKNILYVSSDNREEKIIYYETCEVLSKRVRLLSRIFNKYVLWLVFTALCALAPFAGLLKKHPVFAQMWVALPLSLLALLLVSAYFTLGPATKIFLKKRSERSNFFVRKKDDLLLLVVGATIGAIITVVIQKLLEHM